MTPPYTLTQPAAIVLKNVDMTKEMEDEVIKCAEFAMEKCNSCKEIASYIKKNFENTYNGAWHCVVGRNFGAYVTHETKHYIYFYIGQMAFLLYKSG